MTAVDILHPLLGGAMIGLAAVLLMWLNGRIMGVSGIFSSILKRSDDLGWRVAFLGGTVAAPLTYLAVSGSRVPVEIEAGPLMLIAAGLLVGIGTSLGSGCTSGHGICGLARLSPRSVAATGVFILVAIVTVTLLRHVI